VVVVHHLPSFRLIHSRFAINSINCCFASDSIPEHLLSRAKLWCAGHSHAHTMTRFESSPPSSKATAVVNPVGYPGEETGFDPDWFFVLEGTK
jgi:hypothetical protein